MSENFLHVNEYAIRKNLDGYSQKNFQIKLLKRTKILYCKKIIIMSCQNFMGFGKISTDSTNCINFGNLNY